MLEDVAVLPIALGGFLAVLALGAVGHALAIAVRRRRHELAVLRALGMTRLQSRMTVVTQASVLALIGLALGCPWGYSLAATSGTLSPKAHRWPITRRSPFGHCC